MEREHFKFDLFFNVFIITTQVQESLLHGLGSHQDPQPVPTESLRGLLRINQTIQLTECFPLKGTPFQQKLNFLIHLFPSLANAGELQLCVALSDRLDLSWARNGQLYARARFIVNLGVSFFFFPSPPNCFRKCLAIVP